MKPTGYYILIKMEKVEETTESGIVIASKTENDRENNGHDVGVIEKFGPACFAGYQDNGIPLTIKLEADKVHTLTADERAEMWGCKVGDKVEFNRYDGKKPRTDGYEDYRIIQDQHIIAVIED
jgi:co-chaperonin GroES (HSP10)